MLIRIAVLCVATAIVCVSLRLSKPELALVTALAAGVCACMLALDETSGAVKLIERLTGDAGARTSDAALLLRACGLALIGEYAAQLCRDAGEGGLAQRVEFGARVSLIALAAPLAIDVLDAIMELTL